MNEMAPQECAERIEVHNRIHYATEGERAHFITQALEKAVADERKLAAGELVEVVHAEWIYERYVGMWPVGVKRPEQKCSHCENWSQVDGVYCPSCGALMDGKDDNNADN